MTPNKPADSLSDNLSDNGDEPVFEVTIQKDEGLKETNVFSEEIAEKFPYVKRVVGVLDRSDEEFVLARLSELNERGLERQEGELDKTEKEIELINFAKKAADEILFQFGGANLYDISMDRVHVVKEDKKINGTWVSEANRITLPRQQSQLKFLLNAFHELVHSKVYIALQVVRNGNEKQLTAYRQGLTVFSRDGEDRNMHVADEAAVYELEKIFFDKYVRENMSFSENEKAQMVSGVMSPEEVYVGSLYNDYLADVSGKFYKSLLDKASGQPEFSEYKKPEDIKNLLIRSAVSGDVLKFGRMAVKAFGSLK